MTPIELHDVLKQRAEDINRVAGPTGLVAVAQDEVLQILSALRAVEGAKVALGGFSVSGPDADKFMWAHFDSGRLNASINLSAASPIVCTAIIETIERARSALTHLEGLK